MSAYVKRTAIVLPPQRFHDQSLELCGADFAVARVIHKAEHNNLRQYLYFGTSKASTFVLVSIAS
jgi:hypothetical protein